MSDIGESRDYEELGLYISCENLDSLDIHTAPDSYVIMFYQEGRQQSEGNWSQKNKTETVKGNRNPVFKKLINLMYQFEVSQYVKFEVHHEASATQSKLIGKVTRRVGQIKLGCDADLLSATNRISGKLKIRTEKITKCNGEIILKLSAQNIPRMNTQESGSYLRLYRLCQEDEQLTPLIVYETEYIKNQNNPQWKLIEISAQQLINGNLKMPITVEVWDEQCKIAETSFTIEELEQNTTGMPLKKEMTNKNINQTQSILIIEEYNWKNKYSFYDYLQGGLELNLLIAIDFTGSNLPPENPNSLHHMPANGSGSQYLQAIKSVGNIMIDYDKDKRVSVFGFGGRPKFDNIKLLPHQVSHCFHLNDNPFDPEVVDVIGIVKCYKQALNRIEFSAPTKLHPVINRAMNIAQSCKTEGSNCYQILMILTDGLTNDLSTVIEDIIASSHLPLSIIIIGIGDANFEDMNILDNNDLNLKNKKGEKAQRDLVRFVKFDDFKNSPTKLSENVLKELPDQVVQYMGFMKISPQMESNINSQQITSPFLINEQK